MKKFSLVFCLLTIAGTIAFADSTSLSLSNISDVYYYNENDSISSISVSLSLGTFAGDFMGFYNNTSIGIPVSLTNVYYTGYATLNPLPEEYDYLCINLNSVNCLAFNIPLGFLHIMAGAGLGVTSLFFISNDYNAEPVMLFTVGPAAYAEISFDLKPVGIILAAKFIYGTYNIGEDINFINSVIFETSLGLNFRH